jgi:hypothetical protein
MAPAKISIAVPDKRASASSDPGPVRGGRGFARLGQCFRKQHAYETGWQSEGNEMKHFAAQQNPQNRPF